jgi:hypothetical protein
LEIDTPKIDDMVLALLWLTPQAYLSMHEPLFGSPSALLSAALPMRLR